MLIIRYFKWHAVNGVYLVHPEKWDLFHLTFRDREARSFSHIFTDKKRGDFPDIPEPLIHTLDDTDFESESMHALQSSLVYFIHHLLENKKQAVPELSTINTVGKALRFFDAAKDSIIDSMS